MLAAWWFAPSCFPLVCLFFAALQLLPEGAALAPWLSPVLVLPLLQLLTCSWLTEPLAEKKTHRLNLDLAQRLLHQISKGTDVPQVISSLLAAPLPLDVLLNVSFCPFSPVRSATGAPPQLLAR